VLEKADTERSLLEYKKLKFFGDVICKPRTRVGRRQHSTWQDNIKTWDRAIIGGSSEGNGGLFTVEEDCPQCSQTSYHQGGLKNRTKQ